MLLQCSACGSTANKPPAVVTNDGPEYVAQLIDDSNRDCIGKEIIINEPSDGMTITKAEESPPACEPPAMPENRLVERSETLIPSSITEFPVSDGVTPEIIMPNGAVAIFTQEDGNGWSCAVGDTLTVQFEKYPSEVSTEQPVKVGYINDGVMHEGMVYRGLEGEYSIRIQETGDFYLYFMSGTSDYLSFKPGTIVFSTRK